MKKLLISLLCLAMLVGCSSSTSDAKISDGETVIFESSKTKYTKNDLNNDLKNVDYSNTVLMEIMTKVAEIEDYDMTQAYEEAQSYADTLYSYLGTLSYYGGEEAVKSSYIASAIMEYVAEEYISVKFDTLVEDNIPFKAQIASFDTMEAANAALESIKNGSSFDMAVIENGYDTDASAKVYLDTDENLPLDVKSFVLNTEAGTLSDVISAMVPVTDENGNTNDDVRYYIVKLVSKNVDEFKDEFIETVKGTIDSETILNYVFKKYDISFYDQKTYDLMSSLYEGLK